MSKTFTLKRYGERKGQVIVTVVDDEDYEWLSEWNWCIGAGKYVQNRYQQLMHRLIMKAPDGMFVDHIDGDTLNNQRSNLRLATNQQNACNRRVKPRSKSSPYKGVSWNKKLHKWAATIKFNQKAIHIGLYQSETDAALAYNARANDLFGEFACPNVIGLDPVSVVKNTTLDSNTIRDFYQ